MMSPVFEGSVEELLQRKEEFAGMRVSVFDVPETEALDLPTPPNTVRDKAHLFALLDEALDTPVEETADATYWQEIRQEVQNRLAARSKAQ